MVSIPLAALPSVNPCHPFCPALASQVAFFQALVGFPSFRFFLHSYMYIYLNGGGVLHIAFSMTHLPGRDATLLACQLSHLVVSLLSPRHGCREKRTCLLRTVSLCTSILLMRLATSLFITFPLLSYSLEASCRARYCRFSHREIIAIIDIYLFRGLGERASYVFLPEK